MSNRVDWDDLENKCDACQDYDYTKKCDGEDSVLTCTDLTAIDN